MEDRLDLRLQIHPDHRLGHPVGHGRDGDFIPLLLLMRLGMCDVVLTLPSV
jgi:hypothetical protein